MSWLAGWFMSSPRRDFIVTRCVNPGRRDPATLPGAIPPGGHVTRPGRAAASRGHMIPRALGTSEEGVVSRVPTLRGISMALYMYQASYTAKSMAAQLKDPQDPAQAIKQTLEDLGAKVLVAAFPFGEYDVLIVYEAPDDMTAASVAMAVAAADEVK